MKHYDIESCEQLIKDHKRKGYTDKEIYDMLDVVCDYDFFHFDIMQREANEIQLLFLPIDATPEQRHAFIHDTFAKGWSIRTIAAHTAMPKTTVHRMLATPKEKIFQKVSHTLLGAVNVLHRRRGVKKVFFQNCPTQPTFCCASCVQVVPVV